MISIEGREFSLPGYANFVAVDRDGQLWAYEKRPDQEEGEGIKRCGWRSAFEHEYIGVIGDQPREDWKSLIFELPKQQGK
jgi:hypothetical protein